MPGETEPTPWELHRAVKLVLESLARVETQMLTARQFEEYRSAMDRRLNDLSTRQAGWETESGTEHVSVRARIGVGEERLGTKIEKQAERADHLERAARESKGRTWLAIGVSVLGALLAVAVAVILRGMG